MNISKANNRFDGLTFMVAVKMPLLELCEVLTGPYCETDKNIAYSALHMRRGSDLKGAGWLMLANHEKKMVRDAMKMEPPLAAVV